MPETSTMTSAWRTDSVGGRVTPAPAPTAGTRPDGEGPVGGASGCPAPMAADGGLRRLGAAVARAGHAIRARSFFRGERDGFEEAIQGFAADLAASRKPEAIEEALARFVHRIEPEGRVERVRAGGEPAECRDGARSEEYRMRWGSTDHGMLRLWMPGTGPLRPETARRMTIACTMAAAALEAARSHAEWGLGGGEADGNRHAERHGDGGDPEARAPHRPRDVVRDATFLNAVLPFALEQSRRHGEPVSLVCVKLDRLGAIRDLLGTALADRMVHELGEMVGSLIRASDLVARLDDDRIVALLMRARGEGAMKVARSINRAVAESGLGTPRLPGTTVSIGVAEFPTIARDAASLLDAADEAMAMARVSECGEPILAQPRSDVPAEPAHSHPAAAGRVPEMAGCAH